MDWSVTYPGDDYIFGDFTEHLWAYLTIQQLLEKRSERVPAEEQMLEYEASHMAAFTISLLQQDWYCR